QRARGRLPESAVDHPRTVEDDEALAAVVRQRAGPRLEAADGAARDRRGARPAAAWSARTSLPATTTSGAPAARRTAQARAVPFASSAAGGPSSPSFAPRAGTSGGGRPTST